jgi:hypothetical protein
MVGFGRSALSDLKLDARAARALGVEELSLNFPRHTWIEMVN